VALDPEVGELLPQLLGGGVKERLVDGGAGVVAVASTRQTTLVLACSPKSTASGEPE